MSFFKSFLDDDVSVVISDLLVATADDCDPLLDGSISEVLASMRRKLSMDLLFVAEIVDGRRVFRHVELGANAPPIRPGDSHAVEDTFCQRVLDGRLPAFIPDTSVLRPGQAPDMGVPIGAHLAAPIVLQDGRTYGTLCCVSASANPALREDDMVNLRHCATLVARKLDLVERRGVPGGAMVWPTTTTLATFLHTNF